MLEKMKLNLKDLKVQSFMTSLNNEYKTRVKGGMTDTCMTCPHTQCETCTTCNVSLCETCPIGCTYQCTPFCP
jgi:hypothetical protein